jgi:hypothetical protein
MSSDTSQHETARRAQRIGGSIGTAVFSVLAASTFTTYLHAHAATASLAAAATTEATLASYHLGFWVAAAVFLAGAALSVALFRSGPLPVNPDPTPVPPL